MLNILHNLLRFNTITPNEGGSLEYLTTLLQDIGFQVITKQFDDIDKSSKPTWNLYAYTHKTPQKNITFVGHMDVVHPGHDSDWTYSPFEPTIENGVLYGRGTSDMKATIACFIAAAQKFIGKTDCGLSMLLTYDEEGNAINGTKKMLKFLASEGFTFSDAITGEPTCDKKIGDTIKIGRRGSINFIIEIIGKQGHAAYPHLAKNPMYTAVNVILGLKNHKFDDGNEFFQPTNLEITGIESSTKETNVVPNSVKFLCNVRFNSNHTGADIEKTVVEIINKNIGNCVVKIESKISGESFILKHLELATIMQSAIKTVAGVDAILSTSGGTSDARFMKDYANVIEFGVLNQMAHKVDECVPISDIETTEAIYIKFLELWCNK
jgi:succinyl-diaminopimelate desuccinylase